MMKKTLFAAAIAAALTGCGTDDYEATKPEITEAPKHTGDMTFTLSEKGDITQLEADRQVPGMPTGYYTYDPEVDGRFLYPLLDGAFDPQGQPVFVELVDVLVDGQAIELASGFDQTFANDALELDQSGFYLVVNPLLVQDVLNTGDTLVAVVNYEISNGVYSTPRSITVNINGEDFIPEFSMDASKAYTRDASIEEGTIDLLEGVFEPDANDPLSIQDLTPDAANKFALHTLDGTDLVLDIPSVKSQIADGELVELKYTYKVQDSNGRVAMNTQTSAEVRELTVKILGVADVPGAPLVADYFPALDVFDTDTMVTVDLTKDSIEREGEAMEIVNFTPGQAEVYGAKLVGNELKINPLAFHPKLAAGETEVLTFNYNVQDINGNVADGALTMTVTITGKESNLIAANGANYDFEYGGSHGFQTPWGDPNLSVTDTTAASGSNSLMFEHTSMLAMSADAMPDLEQNTKYWLQFAIKYENTKSPMIALTPTTSNSDPATDGVDYKFWWSPRLALDGSANWQELEMTHDTSTPVWDWFLNTHGADALRLFFFNGDGASGDVSPLYLDNFRISEYGHIDLAENDILEDAGLFEDSAAVIDNVGGATITIDADNGLLLDTASKSGTDVAFSLPLPAGSVLPTGRYLLEFDMNYSNAGDTDAAWFTAAIAEDGGASMSKVFSVTGSGVQHQAILLDEAVHASATGVDWASKTVTLRFSTNVDNAQIYVDNVRLVAIP